MLKTLALSTSAFLAIQNIEDTHLVIGVDSRLSISMQSSYFLFVFAVLNLSPWRSKVFASIKNKYRHLRKPKHVTTLQKGVTKPTFG